jgi:hypothetical protein
MIAFPGCQKEGDTPTQVVDTSLEDGIADMTANFIGTSQSTNGLAAQVAYAATIGSNDTLWKGTGDSVFTSTVLHDTGGYIYHQTYHYQYQFMGNPHPDSISFSYTDSGAYSNSVMSGVINDNGSFTIALLKPTILTYYEVHDGIYTRIIEDTLKVRDHKAFSGSITIEFNQLTVSRTSHSIQSGTADVTFSLDAADGSSNDYTAALTFLPGDKATIVVNGRTYLIDSKTALASYITP